MRYSTATIAIASLMAGLAACSSDSTAPPTAPLPDASQPGLSTQPTLEATTVATVGISQDQANGTSVLASVGAAGLSYDLVGGDKAHSECSFSVSTGRVVCVEVVHNGLTYNRSMAFLDAAGNAQSRRDSNTVSINRRQSVKGTTVRESAAVTIDRLSDFTVTGVQASSKQETRNGTESGTTTIVATTSAGKSTSVMSFGDTVQNVVVLKPDSLVKQYWPSSGTIIRSHSGTRSLEGSSEKKSISRREVMTFNGTALVQVTITVNGESRTCTRDLRKKDHNCS